MRWTKEEYEDYLKRKKSNDRSYTPPPKLPPKMGQARKNKYNNRKTTVDGIEFDSMKEAQYYSQLELLKQAGEIKEIGLQQRFELIPAFEKHGEKYRPITYIADFVVTNNDGTTEVIDVKGVETQVFKIKKKLFEYMYPDHSLKVVK